MDPALPQKLFLMSDANLQGKLRASTSRLAGLLKDKKDDLEVLDELFLATLTRQPTAKERQWFLDYRAAKKADNARARQALFADTLWALINTTEFIFNH
jgi:hypothetical protein